MPSYTIVLELLGLAALIFLNGFFSMAEFALVSSRTFRLTYLAEQGVHGADTALELLKEPNTFLSTIQIAITLIGIGAGAYSGATFSKYLVPYISAIPLISNYAELISIGLIVIVITYLTLLFGELVPKRIGMRNPEYLACRSAGIIRGVSHIFAPLVRLMSASTQTFLHLVRSDAEPVSRVTEDEIRLLIEEGARIGVVQAMEQRMVESIFRLGDRRVFSLMTPRPEIVALDITKDTKENMKRIFESPHSRFPVYREQLDSIGESSGSVICGSPGSVAMASQIFWK
jgi:putative hemolysin